MSTQNPIGGGSRYSLYEEVFDEDNVYMELTGGEFRAACNWEGATYITACIPNEVMDEIARAWLAHRAKNA